MSIHIPDMETPEWKWQQVQCSEQVSPAQMALAALDCGTTDEMLSLMREKERNKFLEALLDRIQFYLQNRAGEMKCGAVIFSNQSGMLGMTKNADALLQNSF